MNQWYNKIWDLFNFFEWVKPYKVIPYTREFENKKAGIIRAMVSSILRAKYLFVLIDLHYEKEEADVINPT